jgi:hypothetical protein
LAISALIFPASFNNSRSSACKKISSLYTQSSIVMGMCRFARLSASSR